MTYQEFKTALLAEMANSNHAELVELVETLVDYTDNLIATHISPGEPPLLPNLNSGSRAMAFPGDEVAVQDPPPLPNLNSGSKSIG